MAAQSQVDPQSLDFRSKHFFTKAFGSSVLVGFGEGECFRAIVPTEELCRKIFSLAHNLSHPGFKGTLRQISKSFAWPNLRADVKAWTEGCVPCQRNKVTTHPRPAGPTPFVKNPKRFSVVHVDLVGPLPLSNGLRNLLTILDRATRWIEAIPLQDTRAETIVTIFFSGWVARFVVPQTIHSDRGPQFTGSLWGHLGQLLGVKNLFTTSYHPESNGIIERFHRTLKTSLAARISQEGESWVKALPFVLLGLRSSTPCIPGSELSPLHLLLGEAPRLPLTLVNEGERLPDKKLFERLRDLKHSPPRIIPETSSRFLSAVDKLKKVEFVFVKNIPIRPSLSPTYLGPFKVLKKLDRVFELDFGHRTDHVSIDRLKPAFGIRDILPSFRKF
eukprot:TRINITY_DN6705_c0_g1_i1.p1 TRINITY_DN6705_c0_g1~~TRINITY_DN6705_c0_g1_i1.p1  ORF type:complete len:388 (-),score=0.04 TRINITY_DN6705_c0_g1_i1:96-1259(-)